MRFCLEVWGTDYEKIKDTCILAEKLGYYGFYYGESLAEIDLDCWSVISNLSAMTETIKLGPVITYLIPHYRNIALLATLQPYRKYQMEDWNLGLVLEQHIIMQHNGGIHSE
jgi:hypothetical protein